MSKPNESQDRQGNAPAGQGNAPAGQGNAPAGQGNAPAGDTPQGNGAPGGEGTPNGSGNSRKFTDDEAAALLKENMAFKKQLKALNDKKTADERAKLEAEGKHKEVAELATARAKRAEQAAILAKLEALALKEGLTDLDLIKLVDTSNVVIDESGAITGAAEAIANFKTAKPAFFQAPGAHVPGTAKPGSAVTGSVKTWADYTAMPEADRIAWARKHPDSFRAIAAAAKAGK